MEAVIGKLSRLRKIVRQNGGIRGSLVTLFRWVFRRLTLPNCRTDELKDGNLVGEDYLGNRYYQNDRYFLGKSVVSVSHFRSQSLGNFRKSFWMGL